MKNYTKTHVYYGSQNGCWATYLTASHELHHEEEVLLVFVDVIQLDNVRVIDLLEDLDLVLEADFVLTGQLSPMN